MRGSWASRPSQRLGPDELEPNEDDDEDDHHGGDPENRSNERSIRSPRTTRVEGFDEDAHDRGERDTRRDAHHHRPDRVDADLGDEC